MAGYELVREIPNLCKNNQMRDVFVSEIETDDPVAYVRGMVSAIGSLTAETLEDGTVRIYVESAGLFQKFLFSPL
ncbi:MAG: hypothetical protein VB055_06580 [Oscillospiraceae bacterium]|nr:hypothetical protein [Oscillospiraceae bacterium]